MARRRRSSKGDTALGMIVIIGAAVVFIFQFVQAHIPEILALGVAGAAIWLLLKWLRWMMRRSKQKAASSISPVQSVAAPTSYPVSPSRQAPPRVSPPPIPSLVPPSSSRPSAKTPGVAEAKPAQTYDSYSTSDVRIGALVDPPKAARRTNPQVGEKARWVAPGEAVTIADVTIKGGMFYLGAPPPSSSLFDVEPCFVDPRLSVAKNRSPKNDPPTYYPSYSKITPSQRRGFLQWMANGRSDPEENLSLVFLFFYGLEYRVFKEGVTLDAPRLIAEAERLLAIYGKNRSFSYYVGDFIAFARAYGTDAGSPALDLEIIPNEMRLNARIYLGRKLADGGAISADDALVWAISSPVAWRRRWPNDQKDVFEDLWRNRFASRFPSGLHTQIPRQKIRAVYRPSSRSFEVAVKGAFENLPDPSADTATSEALKTLVDECWAEGGSYVGAVTRRHEGQSPLTAALLLPEDVWIKQNARLLKTLASYLGGAGTDTLILPVTDIFNLADMSVSIAPKTLLAVLRRLSEGLWTVGVGLEPDGHFADAEVSFSSLVCLFKIPESKPGSGYGGAVNAGARMIIDIAVLCALAAEYAEQETRARIAATIADGIDADDLERARLDAYARVSTPSPERLPRRLKAASQLSTELRETAARASIVAVASGKRLPMQVVRQLEKLHKSLNLPTDELYRALHRAPTEEMTPTASADPMDVVFEAVRREIENQPVPAASANGVAINQERLARAREATQAVSKILSEIFNEADNSDEGSMKPSNWIVEKPPAESGPFEGLDGSHGALLSAVLGAGTLSKSEFEPLARSMKLLASGAIDHINEWAFDRFDEPVIEDGDVVFIAPHLVERIREMREHRE